MSMGSGSAMIAAVLILLFCLYSEMAHAATYTVGDAGGWTFNTAAWPKGKRFRACDTLVFNYSPGAHNVVTVDKAGYVNCRTPRGAKVYTSGNDQIKLARGQNYFICNFSGHCEAGTKIAINAL
ncbi:hypothetical protein L6164_032512 [Bauhinia variegata]|uniref:Uncharacterized protein n=1 Tax=Bauhinia variegata TaxID=167791 RepID=A0ACB9KNV1_BAUVA|nr:hypothetical protein L6164_032512 [Bauhinia variegata]